jgi:hypothetical protein
MKIRFWGVRGSIASPGPKTVRYGGNTTCIEIRTDHDELLILDAGTGIFPLSQSLLAEMPLTANVLLSHTHWDHIQGLPFFVPNFVPGNTLRLHGAFDPISGKGVEQVMAVQLQYSYFPVREAELKARIEYVTLMPEEPCDRLGHGHAVPAQPPGDQLRLPDRGRRQVGVLHRRPRTARTTSTTRTTPTMPSTSCSSTKRSRPSCSAPCRGRRADRRQLLHRQEYPPNAAGATAASTSSIDYARRARARVLFCTHHEPTRSDDALEAAFAQALADNPGRTDGSDGPDIRLAREGDTFEF